MHGGARPAAAAGAGHRGQGEAGRRPLRALRLAVRGLRRPRLAAPAPADNTTNIQLRLARAGRRAPSARGILLHVEQHSGDGGDCGRGGVSTARRAARTRSRTCRFRSRPAWGPAPSATAINLVPGPLRAGFAWPIRVRPPLSGMRARVYSFRVLVCSPKFLQNCAGRNTGNSVTTPVLEEKRRTGGCSPTRRRRGFNLCSRPRRTLAPTAGPRLAGGRSITRPLDLERRQAAARPGPPGPRARTTPGPARPDGPDRAL